MICASLRNLSTVSIGVSSFNSQTAGEGHLPPSNTGGEEEGP